MLTNLCWIDSDLLRRIPSTLRSKTKPQWNPQSCICVWWSKTSFCPSNWYTVENRDTPRRMETHRTCSVYTLWFSRSSPLARKSRVVRNCTFHVCARDDKTTTWVTFIWHAAMMNRSYLTNGWRIEQNLTDRWQIEPIQWGNDVRSRAQTDKSISNTNMNRVNVISFS